jgi:hypothetical protein
MDNIVLFIISIAALLFATSVLLLLLKSKNTILVLGVLMVFIPVEYIHRYFISLPTIMGWSTQLVTIGCGILATIIAYRQYKAFPKFFFFLISIYFLICFLSFAANDVSFLKLIFSQRSFIFLFSIISLFCLFSNSYQLRYILEFTVKIAIVSSFLAFIQRVYVTLTGRTGDMISGLFSVDGQYLFFQCFAFIVILSYWFYVKEFNSWFSHKTTTIILILSIALANNKAGIGFLILIIILCILHVGYKTFFKSFGKLILTGGFLLIALSIFSLILSSRYEAFKEDKDSFAFLSEPEYINKYLFGEDSQDIFIKGGTIRRGAALVFGYNLISKDISSILLGMGPGSTSASGVAALQGYVDKMFPYKLNKTTLSEKFIDLGFLGTISFYSIIIYLYYYNASKYPYTKENALIRKLSILFFIGYSAYENIFIQLIGAYVLALLVLPERLYENENITQITDVK